MSEWISVKERLPERSRCVLGFMRNGSLSIVSQCKGERNLCEDWHYMSQPNEPYSTSFDDLIYWMPLPAPPEMHEFFWFR